jgi:rod shape-determining protein MreD
MIYLLWIVIVFLTIIIQASISLFDITPNLTIVLAFYAGIKYGDIKGMIIGSFIGIIEDSLSGTLLGPNLLTKGLVGYTASFLYSRFFMWTPLLGMVSISLFTFAESFMVFILRSIFNRMPAGTGAAFTIILIQSLFNAPLGLFLKPKKE